MKSLQNAVRHLQGSLAGRDLRRDFFLQISTETNKGGSGAKVYVQKIQISKTNFVSCKTTNLMENFMKKYPTFTKKCLPNRQATSASPT